MPPAGVHAHAAALTASLIMQYRFTTLDVFTGRRFAGNPLAVVFGADEIDTPTMQTIAREFNYPETVFVLRPADPANEACIRIFTPAAELPFAGHPTVGAAVVLVCGSGASAARRIVLEEKLGPVRCKVNPAAADRGHAEFEIPELPKPAGTPPDAATIAAALGLDARDIGFDSFSPARWSAGIAYTFVPVRGLDAIRRCKVDPLGWDAAFEAGGRSSAYVFCRETLDRDNAFHARMFAPRFGIAEDPATGSAVAAFAGLYAQAARPAEGSHGLRLEQGHEMGRPSLIELALTVRSGSLATVTVGGEAVVVTEGTISV
jgi:trans-2,3-dihydro-3-hydroxyanthranilate isomerase